MRYAFTVMLISLFYSCSNDPMTLKKSSSTSYADFFEYSNRKECWMIDSLFSDLEYVTNRYNNGCLFQFYNEETDKRLIIPVYIKEGVICTGENSVEFHEAKLKHYGFNDNFFSRSKEIIEMCEEFKIKKIYIEHNPRFLEISFFDKGDTTISTQYSEDEIEHRINADSTCIMNGWSTIKTVKPGKN